MNRRLAATGVFVLGAVLVTLVIGTQLFARANAAERLNARARATFSNESLAQQRSDLNGLIAIQQGLSTALPALGQQAGLSAAQQQAFIAQFPDFAAGSAQLPQITSRMRALSDLVQRGQRDFVSADAIPTSTRSSTNVPWFILISGILSIGAGIVMLRTEMSWTIAAAVLGIVIVAAPLATSLPQKSADSDRLNRSLATAYTDERIGALRQDVTTLQTMATSLQTQVLPAVAKKLGNTPAEIQTGLTQFFPDLATALAAAPGALTRMAATATQLSDTRADFNEVSGTTYASIAWTVVACGIGVLLLATWAGTQASVNARSDQADRRARRAA